DRGNVLDLPAPRARAPRGFGEIDLGAGLPSPPRGVPAPHPLPGDQGPSRSTLPGGTGVAPESTPDDLPAPARAANAFGVVDLPERPQRPHTDPFAAGLPVARPLASADIRRAPTLQGPGPAPAFGEIDLPIPGGEIDLPPPPRHAPKGFGEIDLPID